MEIALPYRFHRHQHCTLHNSIPETRDTKWSELPVCFRYVHATRGQRMIRSRQQFLAYCRQFMLEIRFHHALVDAVHTRCARSAGCQRDARRLTQPVPVGNQS